MTANPNSETWDEDGPDSQEIATMTALFSEGRLTELETLFRTWTVRFPRYVPGWQALAAMLKQQGRNAEVLTPMQKIAELLPEDAEAHFRLGNTLLEFGQADGAVASYHRALEIKPDYAEAHSNLGSALHELDRLNEAEASCRQALQINPDYAEAHSNLGATLNDLGRLVEAEASFRRALQIKPDFAEALNNQSNTFKDLGRLSEAEACCRRALEIKPDYAEAHHNMGNILGDLNRLDEAETGYRRALEIKPDSEDTFSNLLFVLNYHPDKSGEEIFEVYREYDAKFGLPHRREWRPHRNSRETQRRLKVGYVSPDFYKHSVRHFLEPLLAHHDKNALEIYAYAELTTEDQFTARYKSHVNHWVLTLGIDDATLAERIRADGIDILVDLAGHTSRNRLGVFARKPAPVSLSWLGYGYTTGLTAIDYLLTDETSVPTDREELFSETPWRLATPGYVYRPSETMGEINPLPAMSAGYVTFGTLSRGIRINHRVIRVWSKILKRVEGARLVIDSGSFLEAYTQDSLAEKFAAHGISRDRLQIGCHSPPWDVLRGLDIGLDCFPHNSGTTLFESLYMGVPYITLAGRPSVGRIGSSILEGAGHPEWIARTEDEYVEKAVALAGDLPKLAVLRAGLRQEMQTGPLMDEPAFARKVEAAYREMFEQWAAGMNRETNAGMTGETLTIEQALQQAVEHHQAGHVQDAERLYRAILQVQPHHPEANHNLGVLAVQMKQPAAGLPHFMTALESDPMHLQYWLSYIDALMQADMFDAARQLLALGRQQGLQGGEIEALAVHLDGCVRATEYQYVHRESLPVSSTLSNNTKKQSKTKQNKSAPHKGKNPPFQEINALAALFSNGQFTEALTNAQTMTMHFPRCGFGWKVLGATLKQMGRTADALSPMQKATVLSPDDADAHNNLGNTLKDLGRLKEAETSYRRALKIKWDFVEAHYNLGIILHDLTRLSEAESCYRRALKIRPNYAEAHNNLGITLKDQGRLDDAKASYQRAQEIKPDYIEAHFNLANILMSQGQLDMAEASYRRALEIKPDSAEAHNNLGITLQKLNRLSEAEASCRRALEITPDFAEAHNNLGIALKDQGRLEEAEFSYRRALEIAPSFAEVYNNLSVIQQEQGRLAEAEASSRQALEIKPDFAEAYNNLGTALKYQGLLYDAKACYCRAVHLGFHAAHVKEALMLPDIMGTQQEILENRIAFERNLDELITETVILDDPLNDIGETNFYLAFQGLNDRDLQVKVAKFYAQACPSLLYTAPHCTQPKSGLQKKIRIGFLSKFLYSHSVSRCFSRIIESLSLREPFEATLISSHAIDEKIYSEFAGQHMRLPNNLIRARQMLAELELDILIYLDIGMEPLSYFLAFSRLARVQCVLPGHPVTTGIANIDYFLSTDLMEPFNADEHYSEKLVRLPRPTFYFTRPTIPTAFKTRDELKLPNGRRLYMCPVKLQKIHPDFDKAITRILQIDDTGVVVLFEDKVCPHWKKDLMKRFEITIPAEVRDRIIFLPWLKDPADFISAIAAADVILDPFHFGIGSTAMMIFATNTPLVTKAGEFMRGRGGAFYCEILDLMECIAEDTESYAEKAVAIANNQLLREQLSGKILRNRHVIYDNQQPIHDLIDFFHSLKDNAGDGVS